MDDADAGARGDEVPLTEGEGVWEYGCEATAVLGAVVLCPDGERPAVF